MDVYGRNSRCHFDPEQVDPMEKHHSAVGRSTQLKKKEAKRIIVSSLAPRRNKLQLDASQRRA
jgi:hypothetical protein